MKQSECDVTMQEQQDELEKRALLEAMADSTLDLKLNWPERRDTKQCDLSQPSMNAIQEEPSYYEASNVQNADHESDGDDQARVFRKQLQENEDEDHCSEDEANLNRNQSNMIMRYEDDELSLGARNNEDASIKDDFEDENDMVVVSASALDNSSLRLALGPRTVPPTQEVEEEKVPSTSRPKKKQVNYN